MPAEAVTASARYAVDRLHLRVAWLCGVVLFLEGYDISAVGYAIPSLVDAWRVPTIAFTQALTAGNVGLLLGSLCTGLLGDWLGRKPVLISCVAGFGIFSLLSALVGSPLQLVVLRLLTGLGLGGGIPLTIALASDFAPPMAQGRLVILMTAGVAIGFTVGGWLASQVVRFLGWPGIFAVGGVASARDCTIARAEVARVGRIARNDPAAKSGHRTVPGRARPKHGVVMGNEPAEPAQQLLHSALDASDLARHRGEPLLGDLRYDDVWAGHDLGCLVDGAPSGPSRRGTSVDLGAGVWRFVRAVDWVVRSAVRVVLSHHLWRRHWRWRMPAWNQLAIGPDLSANDPLNRSGLGAGSGTRRHHRRPTPRRHVAGAWLASAGNLHRAFRSRIRRGNVDDDPRTIAAVNY